jgi:hypothetical protein
VQQAKTSVVITRDVSSVAVGIGKVRTANAQQAEAVESLTTMLASLREAATETRSTTESA